MRTFFSFLVALSLCFSASIAVASATKSGANKIFTIGVLSSKPQKSIKNTTPLLNYLVAHLPGYTAGEVLVTNSLNEMADMLESGVVSAVAVTPYAALLIERQSHAKIAAIRWKQGVGSYHSVFFSQKKSSIKELKDLVGHTITFEKASSTSGFFMPAAFLLSNGFELQRMHSISERPDSDKIGYIFIDDFLRQSNAVNMSIGVFLGRFDAAAFSNLDWADPEVTPLKAKNNLQIIAETPPYPRSLVLISPTLDGATEQALLDTLLNADKNEEGIAAMFKFKKTSRFSPISETELKSIQQVRLQLSHHFWLFNNAG